MKFSKVLATTLLVFNSIIAQDINVEFDNISTFSGLSASRTKCVFQDSEGYLWVGTIGGGINHYDGYSFTVYKNETGNPESLINNDVYSIAEDSSGNIWIATRGGVSQFVRGKNTFVNYDLYEYFKELSELPWHSTFEVFVDSQDRIWIGTSYHGALLYDKGDNSFVHIPQQSTNSIDSFPQIYGDFTEDNNGKIWASGGVSGLLWYDEDGSVFRPAPMEPKDFELLKSNDVCRVVADSENNIWVMTTTDLYKYITSSRKLIHLLNYHGPNTVSGGHDGDLVEDSEGTMWLVHENLPHPVKFPKLSNEYSVLSTINMTPVDIFIDSFGIFWICDWSSGLYKYVPYKQTFSQPKNPINNKTLWSNQQINTICPSLTESDQIFILSREYRWGFMRSIHIKTGQVKNYDVRFNNINTMISNTDGTFWLGLWNGHGLIKWHPEKDTWIEYFADGSQTPNLVDNSVTNFDKDEDGNLWIGTTNGLYLMSSDEQELELIIPEHAITSKYLDDDILWLGTYGAGFIKYNIITKKIEQFKHDEYSNSLSHNIVWDVYRDNVGFLWIATENGFNRFDLRTNSFEVYRESDGLGNDYVAAILPGNNGSLWISTQSGISHMYKDSKNRISFSNYDTMEGIVNPDFSHAIKYKDSQGRIYFGGRNGLYYFAPQQKRSSLPMTHITDLKINGISLSRSNTNSSDTPDMGSFNLDLSHEDNTLSIEYIALHFAQPSKNRYAYYLDGYDSDWTYSKNREVQYVNLDPGSYQFHLRAANRDGMWSSDEILLPITIAEPWWNTWYAYILYLGLLISALTGTRKYELNRRKEVENKRFLESENSRKTKELEEARQLQLSMLPKSLPQLPNLDIAVYMKTATEVGGDYYDFHVSMDGTLTVVIGDATGHGMKAGTMVTTAKSLFNSYAPNSDILFSFQEITRCIRQMNFDRLSMCMTMVKIQGNSATMSAAGMPPTFIFRKETQSIEEHLIQGMPLGTMEDFPYQIKDTTLQSGDTILMISDGLPELKNTKQEMFGYKGVRNSFEEVAENSPEDIIDRLKNEGLGWIENNDPDDDVTFVVIKVK